MKTKEEIDELKRQWQLDSIWDIENTEGFEEHAEELKSFRIACEEEDTKRWEDNKAKSDAKIFSLALNETTRSGIAVYLRVPGGWIVSVEHDNGNESSSYTSCFVPLQRGIKRC